MVLASFSFWWLLESLDLCPYHSSLCLVFMRTSVSVSSSASLKGVFQIQGSPRKSRMISFLIMPAKSFPPKEAISIGHLPKPNKKQ